MNQMYKAAVIAAAAVSAVFSAEYQHKEERVHREKHRLSLSEIEKPLTNPQRSAALSIKHAVSGRYNSETGETRSRFYDEEIMKYSTIFIPDFTYGINDSLQISNHLWMPTLTYQFCKKNENKDGVVRIIGPSFAASLGFDFLGFDEQFGGASYQFRVGLLGKIPLNEKLWVAPKIEAAAGNSPSITTDYTAAMGVQLSKKTAVIPEVGLEHFVYNGYMSGLAWMSTFKPTIGVTLKSQFTKHFSAELYGSGTFKDNYEYDLNALAGAGITFKW